MKTLSNSLFAQAITALTASLSFILIGSIVTSFLAQYYWIFELTTHFRVHYALLAVPLIILLRLAKRKSFALLLLIVSLANAYELTPHFRSAKAPAGSTARTISAIILNVNTHYGDPDRVEAYLLKADPDLVVLQEISDQWIRAMPSLLKKYPHRSIETREDNFGITLFSKYPLSAYSIKYIGDSTTPSISSTITIESGSFNIIGTHTLPPRNRNYSEIRNKQLNDLADYVKEKATPSILVGDLNITPYSPHFKNFVLESGLSDSSASHGIQATWPSYLGSWGIPIDHVLYSKDIVLAERSIGPHVGSDHLPVFIRFSIKQP